MPEQLAAHILYTIRIGFLMGSQADMHIFIWAKTVKSRLGGRLGKGLVGTIVSRIRNI